MSAQFTELPHQAETLVLKEQANPGRDACNEAHQDEGSWQPLLPGEARPPSQHPQGRQQWGGGGRLAPLAATSTRGKGFSWNVPNPTVFFCCFLGPLLITLKSHEACLILKLVCKWAPSLSLVTDLCGNIKANGAFFFFFLILWYFPNGLRGFWSSDAFCCLPSQTPPQVQVFFSFLFCKRELLFGFSLFCDHL